MFPTELASESNTQNVRTTKKHQKVQCSRSKDRQDLQIIWEGKAKWYEIMSMFPIRNQLLNPTLRTSEPPKSTKRYSVPEIKDRQCLQIICEGKAKWYEIMPMFPKELAAESNTQNVRTRKKSTQKYSVPEVKTAKIGKSYGREKPNGTKLCLCFLYRISC